MRRLISRPTWSLSSRPDRTPGCGFAVVAALAMTLWGCEPPDLPPVSAENLPVAAVDFLSPDRISAFKLEDGITYRAIRSGPHPWTLHLLEIDPSVCGVGFKVVRADSVATREAVSRLSRKAEPGAVAAINGDFYTDENVPIGLEASDGEVRGWASRPVFAWRPGEMPLVGMAVRDGDSIRVGDWVLSAHQPDRSAEMVSGFPALLSGGSWVGDLEQEERPSFAMLRQPRTAVGWSPVNERIWWVVVDGRRSGSAEGMTLPELARFFQSLGVTEALNLDGGGSSSMAVRGQAVNRPSDFFGERPVVNALVVRHHPSLCAQEGR